MQDEKPVVTPLDPNSKLSKGLYASSEKTLTDFAFSGVEVTTAFRVIPTSNGMTFFDVTSGLSVTVTSRVIWGTTYEFTFGLVR
ncbi:hypothetical protein NPIL_71721 [Nephila pilipes]|uniref:Uncharacterized protein n=1 Tax=Nephila pilipes TaxID=299642 RepID=A0A8X6TWQ6_NEPPI|nr:hypothetical protein NPIL_71721 [Nephila pilipes]